MSNLQEFRKEKGYTQEEFAHILGFTLSMISKVERGFAKPSRNLMERIKEKFPDTDIGKIFFEKEQQQDCSNDKDKEDNHGTTEGE